MSSKVFRALKTSNLNLVENAIVKATYEDDDRPKAKHVQQLIRFVDTELGGAGYIPSQSSRNDKDFDIIYLLQKRLDTGLWRVAIKTITVTHQLMRDANLLFLDAMVERPFIRACSKFRDISGGKHLGEVPQATLFVQRYGRYLEDKLQGYVDLGFVLERKIKTEGQDFFQKFNFKELGKILPRLARQLDSLIQCKVFSVFGTIHPICGCAVLSLFKDALHLYAGFTICIASLCESLSDMSLEQAKWCSKMVDRYFSLEKRFEDWTNDAHKWRLMKKDDLPQFNSLPKSLLKAVKAYVDDIDPDVEVKDKKTKKKKKNKKKKKLILMRMMMQVSVI